MNTARNLVRYGIALALTALLSACGGGTETALNTSGNGTTLTPRLLAPGDTTWIQCAVEGGICTVPASTQVRYGLNGTYATRTVAGSVSCTNDVFGDPLPGADKVCEYASTEPDEEPPPPPPPGDTWTKCADEGGICVFSGTAQVRYGANGTYNSLSASNSIECKNEVFGDPLPGADKVCEVASSGSEPPPPPPPDGTWTKCADEGGICVFSGTAQVRYGANGTYNILSASDSIGCTNEVFGDPLPGADKICEVAASGSEPPPPGSGTVPPVTSGSMTMSCIDGPGWHCSGRSLLRTDNGIGLTSSGVQVYGRSTSDVQIPNPYETGAFGLAPASGGTAEMRLSRDAGGDVGGVAIILSNLGLTWDGRSERPPIIETFTTTQGRVQLDPSGALVFGALPASNNLGFFDYANLGVNGTQANYANNRYFPRSEPSRCPWTPCSTIETTGVKYAHRFGDWRSGGITPDMMDATRQHGDGDVHAGDALPGSEPPWLEGGTGYGVPFPGSKGYRGFDGWSYQYANLGAWLTQDTVFINEWGGGNEHNKNRRGFVAYGAVTDPAAVPASGSATYTGFAYGWHAPNAADDPVSVSGNATVTVNFATRSATISIQNTEAANGSGPVPLAFTATVPMGAAGENVANYMTGPASAGAMAGGLGGRYFGPVVPGGSGAGPAEVAGTFSLSSSSTGQTFMGGFVGRKQ